MKKVFKICPSLVAVALIATTIVGTPAVANAATIDSSSVQQTETQNQTKITDAGQAVKLIENKFLIKNSNGTTSIDENAKKYINSDTLKVIQSGSEEINEKILSGDLKVIKNTNKLIQVKPNNQIQTAGVHVDGDYIWHWYGFDFVMDATNAGYAATQFNTWANQSGYGAGVAGVLKGVVISAASGLTSMVCFGYANDCQLGAQNGRGAILYFYGAPSWAQIYHSSVR